MLATIINPLPAILLHNVLAVAMGFVAARVTGRRAAGIVLGLLTAFGLSFVWRFLGSSLYATWQEFLIEPFLDLICGQRLDGESWMGLIIMWALPICSVCVTACVTARPAMRKPEFTSRTLLLVTACVASVSAILVSTRHWNPLERSTIKEIEQAGGRIEPGLGRVRRADLSFTPVNDIWLKRLAPLIELEELRLSDTKVTGTGLIHLKNMSQLRCLSLDGTRITDETIENVCALQGIESLSLARTQITDKSLVYLSSLTTLKKLDVTRTRVTDGGIRHLTALGNLEVLCVSMPPITPVGIGPIQDAISGLCIAVDYP